MRYIDLNVPSFLPFCLAFAYSCFTSVKSASAIVIVVYDSSPLPLLFCVPLLLLLLTCP